jgi:aspartyl-tRNA(Asn)/glutamyl-tRNA(Gln) amidotransferase subunit A
MGDVELVGLSAAVAARALAAREIAPEELFEAYRARAARDELNCFTWVAGGLVAGACASLGADPSSAGGASAPAGAGRSAAGVAASLGDTPLGGVPLAVKDLFCTEGVPSQSGSRILEGYVPPYTATAVRRLIAAGAPLLGKTNQDEFAMGSSNENSAYGPVLNPWDRTRVPGGSSGGSAAAVAAGLAPWAIGTDTGGSIRQPAALCGIVGLKPTYGAVSRYGMIAFASSLDQAGPLTRDVSDAALMLRHMVGRDECDATSLALPEEIELPTAERLDGVRLGVPDELTGEGIEPGVLDAFQATLRVAEGLGAHLERVRLPHATHGLSAYYVIAPAECSSNLARFDGVRYGLRAPDGQDLIGMYTRTRHDGFGPEVKRRIMLGTYALSAGYYDAYYGRAQRVRTKIVEDFRAAFERVDFVVTPTAPTVAFPLGSKTADPLAMYANDFCTVPMSLAGIPAISIPCGLAAPAGDEAGPRVRDGDARARDEGAAGSEGLPVGFQIAGPAFGENRLLDAAHALEQAIGFDNSGVRA